MAISFTDTFWADYGLNKPDIACLRQDASLYNTLLFQVKDKVAYDNNGIWIEDREKADQKFQAFIALAIQSNSELCITPEYSFPWASIGSFLQAGKFPGLSNIWVLGSQSIRAEALQEMIETHHGITWIYDQEVLDQGKRQSEKFFDPVCICFNTQSTGGEPRKVIVVQFKTMFFGGAEYLWERDNFIPGNKFFVISNSFASAKLLVMLCSDTLQPINLTNIQNGFFLNDPLLVVHIQLNQRPFSTQYKSYRNLLFGSGEKNYKKEVICLNWARGVETDAGVWNQYGGSGFYIKSDKLDLSDERVNENHSKGLYFTRWSNTKTHIYFLDYEEYLFLVENTKPSQDAANPTQYRRTGPRMLRVLKWNNGWQDESVVLNDFHDLCCGLEDELGDLKCIKSELPHIDVERIVELSTGCLINNKNWFQAHFLSSLEVGDDEFNNRINFTQDPEKTNSDRREEKLIKFAKLKNGITTRSENLDFGLSEVVVGYDITIPIPDRYLFNIHSTKDNIKASGVYLGVSRQAKALAIRELVESLFSGTRQGCNVVVWFEDNDGLRKEVSFSEPSINQNRETPSPSFKKIRE